MVNPWNEANGHLWIVEAVEEVRQMSIIYLEAQTSPTVRIPSISLITNGSRRKTGTLYDLISGIDIPPPKRNVMRHAINSRPCKREKNTSI